MLIIVSIIFRNLHETIKKPLSVIPHMSGGTRKDPVILRVYLHDSLPPELRDEIKDRIRDFYNQTLLPLIS